MAAGHREKLKTSKIPTDGAWVKQTLIHSCKGVLCNY